MKIGMQELLIVFIVALIFLGPDKLPVYASKLGEALKAFRKYSSDATKDIRENIVEPLEEAQRPLKEAMQPINDLEKDIKKSMKDLTKPTSSSAAKAEPAAAPQSEAPSAEENAPAVDETQSDDAPITQTADEAGASAPEAETASSSDETI